jgi:hypothetical protein
MNEFPAGIGARKSTVRGGSRRASGLGEHSREDVVDAGFDDFRRRATRDLLKQQT